MLKLIRYEQITGKMVDVADDAARSGWLFDQYINCCKEAWIVCHEEALKQAKYQVAKDKTHA